MPTHATINVLFIESVSEGKNSMQQAFADVADLQVVAGGVQPSKDLKELTDNNIDVVVIELTSGSADGVELTKRIKTSHPNVRVVIVTARALPQHIFAAMDAGADGYVHTGQSPSVLETAIRSVRLGTVWLDPSIAKQVLEAIQSSAANSKSRILPTGYLPFPLRPEEKSVLDEVAASNCADGVCMVDPEFVKKLRRFARITQ